MYALVAELTSVLVDRRGESETVDVDVGTSVRVLEDLERLQKAVRWLHARVFRQDNALWPSNAHSVVLLQEERVEVDAVAQMARSADGEGVLVPARTASAARPLVEPQLQLWDYLAFQYKSCRGVRR